MTITFELYEQYQKQHAERSEKLGKYQSAIAIAKKELTTLQQQYEYFFTEAIKSGKDDSDKLAKLDDQIAQTQVKLEKVSRDNELASAALPDVEISSVDVVQQFINVYAPSVREANIPNIEARLKLARDLIISVIQDGRNIDDEYRDITDKVKEVSKENHSCGKTSDHKHVGHPTAETRVLGEIGGTISGVRKVLSDVSRFTHGVTPHDFEYVEKAPEITKTKGEK